MSKKRGPHATRLVTTVKGLPLDLGQIGTGPMRRELTERARRRARGYAKIKVLGEGQ